MKRRKSEEVSEYIGYWINEDGTIMHRETTNFIPVYNNGTVRLRKLDGKKECTVAHRLTAKAFVEKKEGYNFIRFKDGNNANRHAKNLEWVLGVKTLSPISEDIIDLKRLHLSTAEIAYQIKKTPQYVNRVLKDHKKRMELK
jgi:hypothetical protein